MLREIVEAKRKMIKSKDLEKYIKKNGSVMILHGPTDLLVSIDDIDDGIAYGMDQFDNDVEIDLDDFDQFELA